MVSFSTLSSGFNALAAVTWEDIIKPRIQLRDERQALTITRLIGIFLKSNSKLNVKQCFKAMSYGLLAIGMSFGVGNAGTVLQASMALVGSMVGPLFALFVLGILYPYATAPVKHTLFQSYKQLLIETISN